jgi:hypothetical protein
MMESYAAPHGATAHAAMPRADQARRPAATPSMLNALAEAISSESRLLDELRGIMQRQRSAVAEDDIDRVDDSVYATHRVLLTLGEARRRRRSLNRLISDNDELAIRELEALLGGTLPEGLQTARESLRTSAEALAREVETNRRVLRQAMHSGEAYVRSLLGVESSSSAGYAATPTPETRAGGLLVDRRG